MTRETPTSARLLSELARWKHGPQGEEAWRRFIDLYNPIVYRLAKKKRLDRDEAEGIFQEFCMIMVRRMPSFKYDPTRGRFRDWVLTVTLNLIRRHIRQAAVRRQRSAEYRQRVSAGEFEPERASEWFDDAARMRAAQLATQRVRQSVSERDYAVFRRVAHEGASVKAVAREFELKPNRVHGIKFEVLGRVREIAHEIAREWNGPE